MRMYFITILFAYIAISIVFCNTVSKTGRKVNYVDLTWELHEEIPKHPFYKGLTRKIHNVLFNDVVKVKAEEVCLPTHYGTHMDAPCHLNGSWCLSDIPLERLVAVPTAVIDVQTRVFGNQSQIKSEYLITTEDITEWEKLNGKLPENGLVLFLTGWYRYWNDTNTYLGVDNTSSNPNSLHHPGLSVEASRWMVDNRPSLYGVGIDTVNIDFGQSIALESHTILTDNNMYILENVANLEKLPPSGTISNLAVLKLGREASGAPVRIIARYHA